MAPLAGGPPHPNTLPLTADVKGQAVGIHQVGVMGTGSGQMSLVGVYGEGSDNSLAQVILNALNFWHT